ncbi:MAG TPA: nicotinate-nucleotide adenylyltransferase [Opitutaceae bacterium]|nr:nicotinate-nucleotide adenylyltransferase [Opitutaceae bacterium]
MKLGVLGGSFDPIHLGHLIIAQDACEQLALDCVKFVPAAVSPLKGRELTATADQRLEMVRLAIAGDRRFAVSDRELRRGGTSFTIDTVREIQRERPGTEVFWIIGSDQLQRLAEWKEIAALVRLVDFVHLTRPGVERARLPSIPGLRLRQITGHEVAISSSELRERVSRGLPLRHFVPLKVADFIESQSLYRPNP